MKIGIVTYHRSRNYGALLQAYALQTFLRDKGHDAVMADYWPDYHRKMYVFFSWDKFKSSSLRSNVKYIYTLATTWVRHIVRKRNTEMFVDRYLYVDNSFDYDVAVYGSDQIWRKQDYPTGKRYNSVYFADNTIKAKKKISYAGSMGVIEVSGEKDRRFLRDNWANFDAISVRERDLQELVCNISGFEPIHVLDPVFLLTKEQWLRLISGTHFSKPKKKYLVYYRLQTLVQADKMVERLATERNLEVLEFSGYLRPFKYGKRYKETASVLEFIYLLNDAEFVVANAFHGLAMSICFNKQFYAFSSPAQANRLSSLLECLGIEGRLNLDANSIDFNNSIDYAEVNKNLLSLQEESREWLIKNIDICE